MDGAHDGKHQQRAGSDVARKTYEKSKEAEHQHFLAVEAVYDKSAERADDECCDYIARQHKPYHILVGFKLRVEIDGE